MDSVQAYFREQSRKMCLGKCCCKSQYAPHWPSPYMKVIKQGYYVRLGKEVHPKIGQLVFWLFQRICTFDLWFLLWFCHVISRHDPDPVSPLTGDQSERLLWGKRWTTAGRRKKSESSWRLGIASPTERIRISWDFRLFHRPNYTLCDLINSNPKKIEAGKKHLWNRSN